MYGNFLRIIDAECFILKKDKEKLLELLKDLLNNDLKYLQIPSTDIEIILKSDDPVEILNNFSYETDYVNYDDVEYIEISDLTDGIIFVEETILFRKIQSLIIKDSYIEFEGDDEYYKFEFNGNEFKFKKGTIVYE